MHLMLGLSASDIGQHVINLVWLLDNAKVLEWSKSYEKS
jgi:hypothetical protein